MSRRRRRFTKRELARWPLTRAGLCQRCGSVADDYDFALDHVVELHLGGLDHPRNLIRLCDGCHDAKPYYGTELSHVEYRLAILEWVRTGWWWHHSQPSPLGEPIGTSLRHMTVGIRRRDGRTW